MISLTLEWDALRNNLQFQKSSPTRVGINSHPVLS